jgi:hypothetical protein
MVNDHEEEAEASQKRHCVNRNCQYKTGSSSWGGQSEQSNRDLWQRSSGYQGWCCFVRYEMRPCLSGAQVTQELHAGNTSPAELNGTEIFLDPISISYVLTAGSPVHCNGITPLGGRGLYNGKYPPPPGGGEKNISRCHLGEKI